MLTYRLLLSLAAPLVLVAAFVRILRRQETLRDLAERLGLPRAAGTQGPVIWLHAASVGEVTSARPLIDAALARARDLRVVVTCNTVTGRACVQRWGMARVTGRLAPFDLRLTTGLFLRRWRPLSLWTLEAEIWPNRFALCARRQIPVAWLVARLSERGARRWRRLSGVSDNMRRAVHLISAQDAESEARLRGFDLLGSMFVERVGLKSAAIQPDPPDLPTFARKYTRADTWLAASTHAGEEQIVLDAFARAREARPELRLILAPRHPRRGAQVAALIEGAGWPICRRSKGGTPSADTVVYLADTLGEMSFWYAMAGMCFVGGSLVDKGGHTPFEPAAAGSAILHGPYLSNFTDSYATLERVGGAVAVEDAETLAEALITLTPDRQATLAEAAQAVLGDTSAPGDRLVDLLARVPGLSLLRRRA